MTPEQNPRFTRTAPSPQPLQPFGLGDAVEVVAKPIGAALDALTSHLPARLQTKFGAGNCGCAERKAALNAAVPAVVPPWLQKRP